jgi:mannose/fructose/N-acetylgalactosamine-specific phosphotransferase system component IIB
MVTTNNDAIVASNNVAKNIFVSMLMSLKSKQNVAANANTLAATIRSPLMVYH